MERRRPLPERRSHSLPLLHPSSATAPVSPGNASRKLAGTRSMAEPGLDGDTEADSEMEADSDADAVSDAEPDSRTEAAAEPGSEAHPGTREVNATQVGRQDGGTSTRTLAPEGPGAEVAGACSLPQ